MYFLAFYFLKNSFCNLRISTATFKVVEFLCSIALISHLAEFIDSDTNFLSSSLLLTFFTSFAKSSSIFNEGKVDLFSSTLQPLLSNNYFLVTENLELLAKGEFAPTPIVIDAVKERMKQPDAMKGYVFDGFPRNTEQAEAMEDKGIEYDYVINLVVSEEDEIINIKAEGSTPELITKEIIKKVQ